MINDFDTVACYAFLDVVQVSVTISLQARQLIGIKANQFSNYNPPQKSNGMLHVLSTALHFDSTSTTTYYIINYQLNYYTVKATHKTVFNK